MAQTQLPTQTYGWLANVGCKLVVRRSQGYWRRRERGAVERAAWREAACQRPSGRQYRQAQHGSPRAGHRRRAAWRRPGGRPRTSGSGRPWGCPSAPPASAGRPPRCGRGQAGVRRGGVARSGGTRPARRRLLGLATVWRGCGRLDLPQSSSPCMGANLQLHRLATAAAQHSEPGHGVPHHPGPPSPSAIASNRLYRLGGGLVKRLERGGRHWQQGPTAALEKGRWAT